MVRIYIHKCDHESCNSSKFSSECNVDALPLKLSSSVTIAPDHGTKTTGAQPNKKASPLLHPKGIYFRSSVLIRVMLSMLSNLYTWSSLLCLTSYGKESFVPEL